MSRLSEIGDVLRGFRLVAKSAQGEAFQRIMRGWQFSSLRSTMDDFYTGMMRSKSRSTISSQLPDKKSDVEGDPLSSDPNAAHLLNSNTRLPSDPTDSNSQMSTLTSSKVALDDDMSTTTSAHSSNSFKATPLNQIDDPSQPMTSSLDSNALNDTLAHESSSILQHVANRTNTSHTTILQSQVDSITDRTSNEHLIENMVNRTEEFSQSQNTKQVNTSVPEQMVIFLFRQSLF